MSSAASPSRPGLADVPVRPPLQGVLSSPWTFLLPSPNLHTTVLESAKYFLDPLASSVSSAQTLRQRVNRKRKRPVEHDPSANDVLQLTQLYAEGFSSDQIWEQASRILTSTSKEIDFDHLTHIRSVTHGPVHPGRLLAHSSHISGGSTDATDILDSFSETSADIPDSDGDGDGKDPFHDADSASSVMEDMDLTGDGLESDIGEDSEIASYKNVENEDSYSDLNNRDTYIEDRFGLNDGFFSIDDFNKQTEMFEQQDSRGGPDDVESEDEDIDWHNDPLVSGGSTAALRKPKRTGVGNNDEEAGYSSEEDGPTFDNANIHIGSDSEDETGAYGGTPDLAGWIDTSDIKYADFFAPPPRKVSAKKARSLPKTQPNRLISEEDMDRAMADVRRDLFEDDASVAEVGGFDDGSDIPQGQRSTHEQQRARIADEIRRLEAANVAKKEWMLSGEARGVERPVNSLIEENLEFERIGKPVPVITTEVSEDIEALVKRRILAKEFDEVIRRRPGVADGQVSRRGGLEIEDTKAQQSLAEIYENDHLRATDPNYVDSKSQKLMREHTELASLWKDISSQLDTLSNWHYKPAAPQASINVVTDVAAIMMEDAQPTTSNNVSSAATFAPQEIYTPGGDGNNAGEVILKNGATVSKEEMSRDERARLRRQHKKQKKSNMGGLKQPSGSAAEKQQIVSDLKKGGVKLIGKEGEVTDIQGNKLGANKNAADVLKL